MPDNFLKDYISKFVSYCYLLLYYVLVYYLFYLLNALSTKAKCSVLLVIVLCSEYL